MQLNDAKVMLALKGTDSFKHVNNEDFVISLRSFEGGIEYSNFCGCVSPAYTVLRKKKELHSHFFKFLFKSTRYISALQSTTDSLRDGKSITYEQFGSIAIPLPNDAEQKSIVSFLNYETGKIDFLIEKQKKLIALLKEKRQAVVRHLVTKGLKSDAKKKNVNNTWADNIPQHWRLSKLRYHAKISNGATPNRDNVLFWENGTIGWLNSSKINDQTIESADQFITKLAVSKTSVKEVYPGDLVIAITGEGQTRGRVAICNIEATINQHLAAISITDNSVLADYLYLWLMSNYERIRYESEGNGSTKGAITCSEIGNYPIIIPPVDEQIAIISSARRCCTNPPPPQLGKIVA
ncbi:hypothetical protein BS642_17855 [Chromobacterium violaceum]|nr:hypothetical protein BS642_17855 [Chromobacterium violaceum]